MSFSLVPRLAAAVVLCCLASTAQPAVRSPFDPSLAPIPDAVPLPRWERVNGRLPADVPRLRACLAAATACPVATLLPWRDDLRRVDDAPWTERLAAVNRAVNRSLYASDLSTYGKSDHWASPLEFFRLNRGDCEDFAIAKYASLRLLGIPAASMRILVVEDVERGIAHAILVVREASRVWVLDNLHDQVRPFADVRDYDPYYGLNEDGRWLHRLPTRQPAGS